MRKLFVLVFILALSLRLYQLGLNPISLAWDEAAWGYNAYSLGIDGKDEFGVLLSASYLESFGDFKPPLYAYLTVLPVKLLGLNELATRIPSAVIGSLTIIAVYFLTKEIFRSSQKRSHYALATSFLLAISPWHINLSRAAFEANVAQLLIIMGVFFFLFFIRGKPKLLVLSVLFFVLSLYTFNTARVFVPLLVLALTIFNYRILLKYRRWVMITMVIGILISIPFLRFMLTPQSKLRYHEVNIFSEAAVVELANREIANDGNTMLSRMIHNRRFGYARSYMKHYMDHFNPEFLFIRGDGNPKFSIQDVGQLYLWELPFLVGGVLLLIRKKEGNWWIVPAWLLLGILPAATARETPHALRIETTLPMWQIFTAYGLVTLISNVKRQRLKAVAIGVIALAFVVNGTYYLHGYYRHYPVEYAHEWQYGYQEMFAYTELVKGNYDKIIVTELLGRPYIYNLFYSKIDPKSFREQAIVEREALGFVTVKEFDKYIFTKEPSRYIEGNLLYVNIPTSVPESVAVKHIVKFPNGSAALVIYE